MKSVPNYGSLTDPPSLSMKIIKKIRKDPVLTAEAAGLNYITADAPGFLRKGKTSRFYYVDEAGERCRDKETLKRIKALVLPPAWQKVWVSKDVNGHLQATGMDEAGRKQYSYHPFWNLIRNETKYYRLLAFSKALPKLRAQVNFDLRRRNYDVAKVTALVIKLMDKTCIRVGNQQYKRKHGSSGMTTLDARCTTIQGKTIRFKFTGKKGIKYDIVLRDASLARQVLHLKEMYGRRPGGRLFQYMTEAGTPCPLQAGQVNDYISLHTGGDFSAKDLRTWMGTVTAFEYLSAQERYTTQRQYVRTVNSCLDVVAAHLGNTRAVCKKYYVHPAVFRSFESHRIQQFASKDVQESGHLSVSEVRLTMLLEKQTRI